MTERKKPDSTIIAAVIGGIVTITVTLIGVFANRPSTPAPVIPTVVVITATTAPTNTPVPTDTVPVGEPTSTPAPATDTPAPTLTPSPIPPVALGQDWANGCISALWQPFPADYTPTQKGDGCWQGVKVFSASKGGLTFLSSRNGLGPEEPIGLFAPLPEIGTVTVKVKLKDLTNADLLIGVFADQKITSEGLLITVPAGDAKKRLITQKDPTTYETVRQTIPLEQGGGYEISFSFDSTSASAVVEPKVLTINGVSVNSAQKWLFIGFKGLTNTYRIEGEFLSLELK